MCNSPDWIFVFAVVVVVVLCFGTGGGGCGRWTGVAVACATAELIDFRFQPHNLIVFRLETLLQRLDLVRMRFLE